MKARIIVSGVVQGVFYRENTRQAARDIGIRGRVRNLPDGTVEILAEGEEEKIRELEKWCYQGSPMSKVDNVQVSEAEFEDFREFNIAY